MKQSRRAKLFQRNPIDQSLSRSRRRSKGRGITVTSCNQFLIDISKSDLTTSKYTERLKSTERQQALPNRISTNISNYSNQQASMQRNIDIFYESFQPKKPTPRQIQQLPQFGPKHQKTQPTPTKIFLPPLQFGQPARAKNNSTLNVLAQIQQNSFEQPLPKHSVPKFNPIQVQQIKQSDRLSRQTFNYKQSQSSLNNQRANLDKRQLQLQRQQLQLQRQKLQMQRQRLASELSKMRETKVQNSRKSSNQEFYKNSFTESQIADFNPVEFKDQNREPFPIAQSLDLSKFMPKQTIFVDKTALTESRESRMSMLRQAIKSTIMKQRGKEGYQGRQLSKGIFEVMSEIQKISEKIKINRVQ